MPTDGQEPADGYPTWKDAFPALAGLAVIGNQRTAALLTTDAEIAWYCPGKFDNPSLFASLLDPSKGGSWRVWAEGYACRSRGYRDGSGILQTHFTGPAGEWTLTDWMPMTGAEVTGICRQCTPVPADTHFSLRPGPAYGQEPVQWRAVSPCCAALNNRWFLYTSHAGRPDGDAWYCCIPEGEAGWCFLSDAPLDDLTDGMLREWLAATEESWRKITAHIAYQGPYARQVADSIRAIRLLTYAPNGGIIAAATTSLPEVIGGSRNYDYRYVWLRDCGMIVSALTRAGSDGEEERKFLSFICDTAHRLDDFLQLPLFSIGQGRVADERELPLAGYRHSRPVRTGNNANAQLQLDSLANVLLAAKLIYGRFDTREHWEIMEQIAGFLAENWHRPDHGLWEERPERQYTASKVVVAKGLEFIAGYAPDERQKKHWLQVAGEIGAFIERECRTREGAYAVYAGSQDVDVSAVLFPLWDYCPADTPAMLATISHLEKHYCREHLYWRHLEEFDSRQEGAFLAGACWVAQYWVMRKDPGRARQILDAVVRCAGDLGFFAEEADPATGQLLGNFPQSFVHASFIGAAVDLKNAEQKL